MDRSPSAPALRWSGVVFRTLMWPGWVQSVTTAVRFCDGSCQRQSVSTDVALSEKSPYLRGDRVRWVFWATRM